MRVMFYLPAPFPVSGDRVRVRQQIAWLARTHDIEVLTLVRSPAELEHVEQLRAEGLQVTSVPVRRSRRPLGWFAPGYADDRCRLATSTRPRWPPSSTAS